MSKSEQELRDDLEAYRGPLLFYLKLDFTFAAAVAASVAFVKMSPADISSMMLDYIDAVGWFITLIAVTLWGEFVVTISKHFSGWWLKAAHEFVIVIYVAVFLANAILVLNAAAFLLGYLTCYLQNLGGTTCPSM